MKDSTSTTAFEKADKIVRRVYGRSTQPRYSATRFCCAEPSSEAGQSTSGRPRKLTDQQVAWVLTEYSRYLAWRAQRTTVRSQRQLAKELGVSQGTVGLAIRWRGQYKQLSPELRSKRRPAGTGS